MLIWKDAKQNKPQEEVPVLLKIRFSENPVVGLYVNGSWKACTDNMRVDCRTYCQGGVVVGDFESYEVAHYAEIGMLP